MKKELFEELLESVRQGGEILRGERAPSRSLLFEEPDVRGLREGAADPPDPTSLRQRKDAAP